MLKQADLVLHRKRNLLLNIRYKCVDGMVLQ
jgi:hypothetical protein